MATNAGVLFLSSICVLAVACRCANVPAAFIGVWDGMQSGDHLLIDIVGGGEGSVIGTATYFDTSSQQPDSVLSPGTFNPSMCVAKITLDELTSETVIQVTEDSLFGDRLCRPGKYVLGLKGDELSTSWKEKNSIQPPVRGLLNRLTAVVEGCSTESSRTNATQPPPDTPPPDQAGFLSENNTDAQSTPTTVDQQPALQQENGQGDQVDPNNEAGNEVEEDTEGASVLDALKTKLKERNERKKDKDSNSG